VTVIPLATEQTPLSPGDRSTTGGVEGAVGRRPAPSAAASGFVADTWVFFASPHTDWSGDGPWGLGFGPAHSGRTRWSLFHCVSEDRFDAYSTFPRLNPSNRDLLRWSTSVVGAHTASSLLESIGSCHHFYQRYFAERPDLRNRFRR